MRGSQHSSTLALQPANGLLSCELIEVTRGLKRYSRADIPIHDDPTPLAEQNIRREISAPSLASISICQSCQHGSKMRSDTPCTIYCKKLSCNLLHDPQVWCMSVHGAAEPARRRFDRIYRDPVGDRWAIIVMCGTVPLLDERECIELQATGGAGQSNRGDMENAWTPVCGGATGRLRLHERARPYAGRCHGRSVSVGPRRIVGRRLRPSSPGSWPVIREIVPSCMACHEQGVHCDESHVRDRARHGLMGGAPGVPTVRGTGWSTDPRRSAMRLT